ncbi:unnamed protein product [Periconia digitata]|uniref:C2H2-type domain-containing protein n=1 Tax=Periconia digitata TaxID=1303443 RepID=A0A9W4XJW2_9PLEO|nr:unnamed protein product [Periconia digitata]
MSSNSYNPYNYPYHQSAPQQQYSTYQTAPATNNPPQASSRQYQQPSSQATDYGFYQAPSYSSHGTGYDGPQDRSGTWNGTNYGANRETTSRAAEVLHNMSNTAYTANPTPAQPSFPAINNTPASRYTPTNDRPQARPPSVNTNRAQASTIRGNVSPVVPPANSTHRTSKQYSQTQFNQPQRTASPAQYKATNTQYSADHAHRQLPKPGISRTSYGFADPQITTPTSQTSTSAPDPISQTTTTVDPMAVYDPWPEYQRKAEAQRAQKAVEDAARLEEEKKVEQKRKEEEERQRREEEDKERNRKDEENARLAQMNSAQQDSSTPLQTASETSSNAMEEEIRALMSRMREFNSKDPALLARIWEEERRAKAPKSPNVQNKPAPQAVPTKSQTPVAAIPRQSTASKETTLAKGTKPSKSAKAAKVAKAISVPTPATPQPQPQPTARPAANHTKGSTVWPPEKKTHLASAAASYLSSHNPTRPVEANEVLLLLDRNPSYIELCEQLEQMGIILERAAFAKTLLQAVPDVNSGSRPKPGPAGPVNGAHNVQVATPAVIKGAQTPTTPLSRPQAETPGGGIVQYPPFPINNAPVAEMIPIRSEHRQPATKEEAARKRTFNDLIDLTMPEDEDEPAFKKSNLGGTSHLSSSTPMMQSQSHEGSPANFPLPSQPVPRPVHDLPPPSSDLRHDVVVQYLDRKNALRRNTYNIKTIARDILLACGRHPETRQLNQHLDILKTTLPQVTNDADLSTLNWEAIDPGRPPVGYFKEDVMDLTGDADDEDESDEEDTQRRVQKPQDSGVGTDQQRTQTSVEAINPFKLKRRGRPPRSSLPAGNPTPYTPKQKSMSSHVAASAPQPSKSAASVGYSAFRSATQYDADGNPLPKKRGRPVGWRKNIHGSAAAQSQVNPNGNTGLRDFVGTGQNPITVQSRSPSMAPRYTSFKCKWEGCSAELHNLETLRKHVFKLHRKETSDGMLECLWSDCRKDTRVDLLSNVNIESSKSFASEKEWQEHLGQAHFQPLAWKLGDGQASGVSDTNDSEAYLSDAQGRNVTPRIIARADYLTDSYNSDDPEPAQRKRPRDSQEQHARDAQDRMISRKKRVGGPGMDRGGSTLANEKRRRGFLDVTDTEEELVDAES